METKEKPLSRSEALLGAETLARLEKMRIVVFGVGGVGSWCAECLVRTGARQLTLVDDDVVAVSNLNRQDQATAQTLGVPKVEALRRRLLEIAPDAAIEAVQARYGESTAERFSPERFDCAIDAIDSVVEKMLLITRFGASSCALYSSMGAALRLDPTRVRISDFRKVEGDGLARALRQRFKREGVPVPRFQCVWSDEPPCEPPSGVRGSLMQVTGAFGLALASLVVSSASRSI